MADHPEEFEGYGRFSKYLNSALRRSFSEARANLGMTDEDAEAIRQAWAKINAPKFTEGIIKAIMSPPETLEFTDAMRLGSSGQFGIGNHPSRIGQVWTDPKSIFGQQQAMNAAMQNQTAIQGAQFHSIMESESKEQPKGFFASIAEKVGF